MKKVVVTREVFDETIEYLSQRFDVTSNQEPILFANTYIGANVKGFVISVAETAAIMFPRSQTAASAAIGI